MAEAIKFVLSFELVVSSAISMQVATCFVLICNVAANIIALWS